MSKELSLYDIDRAFAKIIEEFPERKRTLVKNAGEKMFQGVLRNIERDIKEGTGTLKRGVEKKLSSGGGYAAVRPNHAIAPHTHLVENGHRVVARGKSKKTRGKKAKKNSGRVKKGFGEGAGEWVNGKFIYRNALTSLESELRRDSKNALERLVKDSFG